MRPAPPIDSGPEILEQIAQAAESRSQLVLRGEARVAYAAPARCEYAVFEPTDRAWRNEVDGRLVWCVIDHSAHRELLECILDGPGAATPTAVERTIVAECIERLLCVSPRSQWHDSESSITAADGVWRCDVDISNSRGSGARLHLYTAAEQIPVPNARPQLDDVQLTLHAFLRPTNATLGQLARWEPGTMIPLGVEAASLEVRLKINGGPEMFGFLGASSGKRAVRLNGSAARKAPA